MRDLKQNRVQGVRANRPRRPKRALPWRRIFGVTAALCLVSVLIAGAPVAYPYLVQKLQKSPLLSIQGVEVVEAGRISSAEILALSELQVGDGLFDLDLAEVARRIEANPWIETARVQRIFPNRLLVQVQERTPRAIVNLGYLYYLDDSGEVFKPLAAGDDLDFPVVTGLTRQQLEAEPDRSRADLKRALSLIDELSCRQVFTLKEVSEIHLEPSGELTLYTRHGGVPVWVGAEAFANKIDRLERIYNDLKTRLYAIKYIDLNIAHRLIVKIAEPDVGKG